jgi:hypothetical protein
VYSKGETKHKGAIEMKDELFNEIQALVELESEHPGLVSRPLLCFAEQWLLSEDRQERVSELCAALEDGLDVDFMGTQWEAEWLADGKVCKCKACTITRSCVALIEIVEGK